MTYELDPAGDLELLTALRDGIARNLDAYRADPAHVARFVSWAHAALEDALEDARTARLVALRQLRAEGFTLEELAEISGLSRARVHQLLRQ